jgi:CRISPR/Cas system-associated exonuclease Cas4 (RecB family)
LLRFFAFYDRIEKLGYLFATNPKRGIMSLLPSPFNFSQSSLQDYTDCPRRFQLRYLERLAWPAAETEPTQEYERHQREGSLFHRLVQQHLLGIPAEKLSPLAQSEDLNRWWEAYLKHFENFGNAHRLFPEYTLSAPLGSYRLVAKYDLVAVTEEGNAVIYDWKSYRKRPRNEDLAVRWQTRLYPFLLEQAGSRLNDGKPIPPHQIKMIYWFANYPDDAAVFSNNENKSQQNRALIEKTVQEIAEAKEFPMCEEKRACRFCTYRSFCDRGVRAGNWDAFDDDALQEENFTLDFEQIGEIAF